jgi:hypothetical protein
MGKSTISMAIFNSYVTNYQRVTLLVKSIHIFMANVIIFPPVGSQRTRRGWEGEELSGFLWGNTPFLGQTPDFAEPWFIEN